MKPANSIKHNLTNGLLLGLSICTTQCSAIFCPCTNATEEVSPEELEIIDLINEYRLSLDLPEISPSITLSDAAHRQALDLCENKADISHIGTDGSTTFSRAEDAGYNCGACSDGTCVSEIGFQETGCAMTADAVETWKMSECHNAIITNDKACDSDWSDNNWQSIGVGISGGFAFALFGECPDQEPSFE